MSADHDEVEKLPPGTSERQRWRWSMDFDEDFGGGFAFGTLLLRDDGQLLCAHGDDVSHWFALRTYPPTLALVDVAADLTARGYDLYEPDRLDDRGSVIPWKPSRTLQDRPS